MPTTSQPCASIAIFAALEPVRPDFVEIIWYDHLIIVASIDGRLKKFQPAWRTEP
jgi:hypothetical protein